MIFGSDGEGDEPSLIIDGVRIPFQMEAHVSYGPAEGGGDDDDWSDWDDDAPWMITLPVEVQVMLPYEILYPPAPPRPALPTQEHADPHPGPEPAAWGPGAIPLPRIPDRDEPVTLRALQSLRLDETLGQRAGGWSGGLPELAGLVFPEAPDAGDPADAADDWHPPATGTGPTGGTTGQRAVDAAFAAGRIDTLDRMLRSPGPAGQGAASEAARTVIQPVSDHHAADGSGAEPTNGVLVGGVPIARADPPAPQGDPEALDRDRVLAALRRGMRDADRAPAVHPTYRLAQVEPEAEGKEPFEELLDPLAPVRTATFNDAIARLRAIDPDNPNLTYVVPPNWVPTQDAIDRVNDAITAALVADLGRDHSSHTTYKTDSSSGKVPTDTTKLNIVNSSEIAELTAKGVKFSPDLVVATGRSGDGQVVFLENGDARSGLQHIIDEHASQFADFGVSIDEIPRVVMEAATKGKLVGYQGAGTGRPIYQVEVNGKLVNIAITFGSNGYIVGANPRSSRP